MFYETSVPAPSQDKSASALISLTPAESKRLIGKGVAAMPEVRSALKNGLLVINWGSTNAFVAEEVQGVRLERKGECVRGCITGGEMVANLARSPWKPVVLKQGKPLDLLPKDAVPQFMAGDVFIKGANAVDPHGQAGVLAAGVDGGTIGGAWPILVARGAHLIVPVGLEKLVPSVIEASRHCGIFRFKYSTGLPCALIPLVNALVVTEVQALSLLCGVSATHVASGGIGGSEGSVVLCLEGGEGAIEAALSLVKSLKGEPAVPAPATVTPSAASLNYDSMAVWRTQNQALPRPLA